MNSIEQDAREKHGDLLYNLTWKARSQNPNLWFDVFLVACVRFAFYILTLRWRKGCIAFASSTYSIAGDIRRRNLRGFIWKMLFLVSGVLSVASAYTYYFLHFGNLDSMYITDLDVLGSIISKAKRWKLVENVYFEITHRYSISEAPPVTYALAIKWAMDNPRYSKATKEEMKGIIRRLLNEHSEWGPEIRIRLYEALGDNEAVKRENERISKSVS